MKEMSDEPSVNVPQDSEPTATSELILYVHTANKVYQDGHAAVLARDLEPFMTSIGGHVNRVVNQFGLNPALIVLDMPEGAIFPKEIKGVDLTGVTSQP
jgi:hypothetical protein